MSVKVNGDRLEWVRYEFSSRDPDGTITRWDSLEDASAAAELRGGEVMMRAVYATGWSETL